MNRELHSGETKAPKPQCAAHPAAAAALSWAEQQRGADNVSFWFKTRERGEKNGEKD